MLSLFTKDFINTDVLDYYTYNAIRNLGLVYPQYNKIVLANTQNTFHEQAHLFKARIIKNIKFEDKAKTGKILDFLNTSLFDSFGKPINFLKYLQIQLYNDAKFEQFFDELQFDTKFGNIQKISPLSSKYMYPTKDKKGYWQIIPNADFQATMNQPGSVENNTNYAGNMLYFSRYDTPNKIQKNRVLEFSGLYSKSDYFPDIPYLSTIGTAIKTNRLIGEYEQKWLENGTVFKNILELVGVDSSSPEGKRIVEKYKRDLNNVSRSGEIYIITNPTGEQPIRFLNPVQAKKEDFSNVRDTNRDEIIAGNGLNPTIVGIKTNESSLTSTSQAEALKLYKETYLDNKIADLQFHYDTLFKQIDNNYNTKVIFETISYEDDKANAGIDSLEIANEEKLIVRGNLEDFNKYRQKIKKREVKQEEFNKMFNNLNLNFVSNDEF